MYVQGAAVSACIVPIDRRLIPAETNDNFTRLDTVTHTERGYVRDVLSRLDATQLPGETRVRHGAMSCQFILVRPVYVI